MAEIVLYRDNMVELDFKMPKTLKNLVEEADQFYEAGDWFWYDIRCSEIETTSKQEMLCGLISQESLKKVWKRYGINYD